MLERIRRLPSPALVISAIALVIAIGGGGYALASLNGAKVKRIAKKQADKEIKKKASGLSVAHATSADNATHATTADNATSADNATHATSADNATHATSADNATNANQAANANHAVSADSATNAATVGGETVKNFFMKGPANTAPTDILHLDGLRISAGCNAGGSPIISAIPDTGDTQIKGTYTGDANSNQVSTSSGGTLDLVGTNHFGSGSGTYSTSTGKVVSFSYSFDNAFTYGTFNGCTVVGQAIGG